jgi:hypothetical protein
MPKPRKRVPPAPPAPANIHLPPGPPDAETKRTDIVTAIPPSSPRWGVFTKFLVSLVLVVITGALLVRFQEMITPLVVSVILTYLLRPVVERLTANTRLSWGVAAALVYLISPPRVPKCARLNSFPTSLSSREPISPRSVFVTPK